MAASSSPSSSARQREHEPDYSERDAEILAQHLDPQFTASLQEEILPSPTNSNSQNHSHAPHDVPDRSQQLSPEPHSSLTLQGGDVHRDLYRIEAKSKHARLMQRSNSYSFPPRAPDDAIEGSVAALEPGSFRRHFVQHRNGRFDRPGVTISFVDFLGIYGNFAGEDLEESEDESEISEERDRHPRPPSERSPLLGVGGAGARRRKRTRSYRPGDASNMKTFFTLLKAFVGTGIIFLPKAFRNGGILFSSVTLVTVSIITTMCFHLLLQCRRRYGGGYGDLGERICGPQLRSLILSSVAISQVGFVCACIIFTAENVHAFLRAASNDATLLFTTGALIAVQLVVLIPFSWIRNISKLGPAALLADVFILMGLAYIYCYDVATLASRPGLAPSVELFNKESFTLTIGSCIFTFEGIGLILPIQSSMKRPQHFDCLLYIVMAIITVLFTAVGALSYATFGADTKTEIFSNFPQSDKFVNTIQFLYALAILVGTPIQLFPATRILEGKIFGSVSGKSDPTIKWKKNVFRTAMVLACGVISAVGAGDLDKFVSLIGSFACVPLVYIYPAYLHYRGVAESPWVKRGDLAMVALGFVFMVYTTGSTVSVWVGGGA